MRTHSHQMLNAQARKGNRDVAHRDIAEVRWNRLVEGFGVREPGRTVSDTHSTKGLETL